MYLIKVLMYITFSPVSAYLLTTYLVGWYKEILFMFVDICVVVTSQ
jgi:hypothetical protein